MIGSSGLINPKIVDEIEADDAATEEEAVIRSQKCLMDVALDFDRLSIILSYINTMAETAGNFGSLLTVIIEWVEAKFDLLQKVKKEFVDDAIKGLKNSRSNNIFAHKMSGLPMLNAIIKCLMAYAVRDGTSSTQDGYKHLKQLQDKIQAEIDHVETIDWLLLCGVLSPKTAKINSIIANNLTDKYNELRLNHVRNWLALRDADQEEFNDEERMKTKGLLVDQLVQSLVNARLRKCDEYFGRGDFGDDVGPCYPPRSIKDVCKLFAMCGRTADKSKSRVLRLLVYHLFKECEELDTDLGWDLNLAGQQGEPGVADTFASISGISAADRRAVNAFVLIDNKKFKEGSGELRLASVTVLPRQSSSVLQVLHDNAEYEAALALIQAKHPCLSRPADLLLYTHIVLQAKSVPDAFEFIRQSREDHWEETLLDSFFKKCYDTKQMHMILKLPLDSVEGRCLEAFLDPLCQRGFVDAMEVNVLYLLGRARYVEAVRVCDAFAAKHADKCTARPTFHCLQALLQGYKKLLPKVQLDLTHGDPLSRATVYGAARHPKSSRAPPSLMSVADRINVTAVRPADASMDESMMDMTEAHGGVLGQPAQTNEAFVGPPMTPSRERRAIQGAVSYIDEVVPQPDVLNESSERAFTPQVATPDNRPPGARDVMSVFRDPPQSILKSKKKSAPMGSPAVKTPIRFAGFLDEDDEDDDDEEITFHNPPTTAMSTAAANELLDDSDITFAEVPTPSLGVSFGETQSPAVGESPASQPTDAMETSVDASTPARSSPLAATAAQTNSAKISMKASTGQGLRGANKALKTPPRPAGLRGMKNSGYRPSPLGATTPHTAANTPVLRQVVSTPRVRPVVETPAVTASAGNRAVMSSPAIVSSPAAVASPLQLHRLSTPQMRPGTSTPPRSAATSVASPRIASPMVASPMVASPMVASPMPASPMPASPMPASVGKVQVLAQASPKPSPKALPPTLLQMTPNQASPGSPFVATPHAPDSPDEPPQSPDGVGDASMGFSPEVDEAADEVPSPDIGTPALRGPTRRRSRYGPPLVVYYLSCPPVLLPCSPAPLLPCSATRIYPFLDVARKFPCVACSGEHAPASLWPSGMACFALSLRVLLCVYNSAGWLPDTFVCAMPAYSSCQPRHESRQDGCGKRIRGAAQRPQTKESSGCRQTRARRKAPPVHAWSQ